MEPSVIGVLNTVGAEVCTQLGFLSALRLDVDMYGVRVALGVISGGNGQCVVLKMPLLYVPGAALGLPDIEVRDVMGHKTSCSGSAQYAGTDRDGASWARVIPL